MSNEDHLWYRAKILEALDDYVLVHYIDYGNSEEISTEQIREIPASLLGEALSYRCILRAQAVTEASSLSPLLETYINKVLSVAFCDTEDMNTLTLKCDDQNIFKDLDVLELISNPTKAFNGESLEICQEPVHGCQVCSEQDCSEDGYKDPQYLVSSREASMLKRTQAPREKSSNCKGNELGKCSLKQTVLCDKASFTGEDTQFHEVKSKQKCLNIENEQTYNMHNSHEELCNINIEPNERDKNRGALCRQIQTEGGEPLSEGSSEVPDYSPIFMVVNKQRERNLANETTLSNIKVAPASFNSKENLCVKEKINKVVYGNYSDFMLRPSELKIEAFTSYKRHTVKSHLHAIEEVEESETIDMSELKVRPYRSLLVHVEEIPFCLWIQKEEDIDLAEFVRSSLEELGEEMELLDSPQVGELCVAFLHESCQRAQVIALTSHEATVHYMDHGKYGRVPLKKLYKLQQEFLDIPPLVSQVYLPVKVIPGKESGAVLAVAEAALHSVCVCFDLDQLTYIRDEMYTLVSTPWSGSLGDLLVRNELAWPVNWESKLGLHMASSVTKLIQEYINELCDDSERRDYCVTPL
nr:uncharacterized protein LOC128687317 [Cherax quadricarinatus]